MTYLRCASKVFCFGRHVRTESTQYFLSVNPHYNTVKSVIPVVQVNKETGKSNLVFQGHAIQQYMEKKPALLILTSVLCL